MNFLDSVRYSTNYNPQFTLENIFKEFEIEYLDGRVAYKRDYMGSDMVRLIKRLPVLTTVQYDGSVPLTTVVNNIYGSTTPVHVVILYNGLHPLEITPGRTLNFPNLDILTARLQRSTQRNSNIGKTAII